MLPVVSLRSILRVYPSMICAHVVFSEQCSDPFYTLVNLRETVPPTPDKVLSSINKYMNNKIEELNELENVNFSNMR